MRESAKFYKLLFKSLKYYFTELNQSPWARDLPETQKNSMRNISNLYYVSNGKIMSDTIMLSQT